jgi:ABC-type uncharacterized transport system substrate-binding protein
MKIRKAFLFLVALFFIVGGSGFAADKGNFSKKPVTNNGKKWRIAYYEGGEYIVYQQVFTQMINGLMELGWIEKATIPPQSGEQTTELWKWIGENIKSDYLEFPRENHYTAGWDDKLRTETREKIIARLGTKKDVDLLLAVGTWAGKDMANERHATPTMVISTSDAVGAGIIKSIEDSGIDHITARADPYRYERQIKIFHDIIGFQKLGVPYENTEAGRSIASIGMIERLGQELGFEVVHAHTTDDTPDKKVAEESVKAGFKELASKKVDAIYVVQQNGVNSSSLPALVQAANASQIPTFSQIGSDQVKKGILLSISQAGFKYLGGYHAQKMAKIFNNAKPRQLDQMFESPPKIAINLETAEHIGFDPPVDVLNAADEIFEEIGQ